MPENQLTIINQVQEVAAKSGVPLEIDVTQLATLAERGRAITTVNHPDFYSVKKEMQQTRTQLKDYFMDARRGFNKLAEGVRDVEKAVLGEFTPEEDRLIALDKAEKERVLKETRLAALPAKRERITTAGIEFTDEEVLAMTDADFELEFAKRVAAKAEADRLAAEAQLAADRAALEAEKAELARKQAEADAIEAARKEEREKAAKELELAKEKAEREAKEAKEKAEREAKEAKEKAEREAKEAKEKAEREAKEAKEKAEREEAARLKAIEDEKKAAAEAKAKQEADAKYQAFLKENNYNPGTDRLVHNVDGGVNLYRFVAEFKN